MNCRRCEKTFRVSETGRAIATAKVAAAQASKPVSKPATATETKPVANAVASAEVLPTLHTGDVTKRDEPALGERPFADPTEALTGVLDRKEIEEQIASMGASVDALATASKHEPIPLRRHINPFDESEFDEGRTGVISAVDIKLHIEAMADEGASTAQSQTAPGGSFVDADTDLMDARMLSENIAKVHASADPATNEALRESVGAWEQRLPVFLRRAVIHMRTRGRIFMAQSWRQKILVGFALMGVVVLLASVYGLLGDSHDVRYLDTREVLRSGPGDSAGFVDLGSLPRGSRLVVYDEVGEYGVVRDVLGRAGYVPLSALVSEQPAAEPEYEFADCRRSPLQANMTPCMRRAHGHFDSCRVVCGTRADNVGCFERCQTRLEDCQRACGADIAPSDPEPRLEEPSPVAAETTASKKSAKSGRKKSAKKKTSRKRKRKRR